MTTLDEIQTAILEIRNRLGIAEDDKSLIGNLLNYLRANEDDISDCLSFGQVESDNPTGYCPDHGEYDPAGDCPKRLQEEPQ